MSTELTLELANRVAAAAEKEMDALRADYVRLREALETCEKRIDTKLNVAHALLRDALPLLWMGDAAIDLRSRIEKLLNDEREKF